MKHIERLLDTGNFKDACELAEKSGPTKDFFETWAKYCGAPKEVFVGNTIRMILDMQGKSNV